MLLESAGVHPEAGGRCQADGGRVRDQEALADGLAEAVEGAPQAAARLRLVAFGPEQGGQRLPTLGLVGDRQVGQQRHGTAQRQGDRLPVALQSRGTEEKEL
jgi:hypothetical protein